MKPIRCGILALACLLAAGLALAQGDPDPLREAISREFSVFIGAEPETLPYREAISRELSVFIGAEPEVLPYREAISRELSVFIGAEPEPPYREVISREVSVLQPHGASFFVTGREQVTLPTLHSYEAPAIENGTTYFQATGAGSLLSFPNLTNLVGNPRPNGILRIEALQGGRVDLASVRTMTQPTDGTQPTVLRGIQVLADGTNSVVELSSLKLLTDLAKTPGTRFEVRNGGTIRISGLTEIGTGAIAFTAEGAGSLIDLSSLVRFIGGSLEAKSGGVIRTPRLLFVDRARLIVRGTGQLDIAQIQKLTHSRVTADGRVLTFAELFNWAGTVFETANGGSVSLPQIEFVLSQLTVSTNELWCGAPITVSWQGTNRTGAAVLGSWTDALYLSADDRWDIDDILIGAVDQTAGLAANAAYTASTNVIVAGVLPGDYHLLVRSVALGFAGTLGSDSVLAVPTPVLMPELVVGTPVESSFITRGHARYWRLVTEADKDLKVSLDLLAATGATELYLRRDAIPTRSQFDVKYSKPGEPDQFVRVPGTQATTNYVMAYGEAVTAQAVPLGVFAEYLPFEATSIEPNRGGNLGSATVKLLGTGISSNSLVTLSYTDRNGEARELAATSIIRRSAKEILATFDLRGISAVLADVSLVSDQGTRSTLPGAYSIEAGHPIRLELHRVGPVAARRHRIPMRFSVTVKNTSNIDADLVLVSASVPNHPTVSLSVEGPLSLGTAHAIDGRVSYLLPRIAGYGEVVLNFELRVDDAYPEADLPITWRAGLMSAQRFAELVARKLERTRLAIVAIPDLVRDAPDVYALVADQGRWNEYMMDQIHALGFVTKTRARVLARGGVGIGQAAISPADGDGCGGDGDMNFICGLKDFVDRVLRRLGKGWLWEDPICKETPSDGNGCGCGGGGQTSVVALLADGGSAGDGCGGDSEIEILTPQDPNGKTSLVGWGPEMHVAANDRVAYTIGFENLPAASAAALLVQVHDRLPAEVDWASLELQEIAFAGQRIAIPPGLAQHEGRIPFDGWTWNQARGWHRGATPLMVDVKAGVDLQTGLLTLNLTCSDTNTGTFPADAYAGFLPPNRPETFYYPTNATDCCGNLVNTNVLVQPGQGYLVYTVKPKANLPTGTVITNAARIVFDWNDPIDTPVVFNTIDAGAPTSQVEPLPELTGRTFLVEWAGQDDVNGCGVAGYDVYVSDDGENYTRWLADTLEQAAVFPGERGVAYSFYSIARDWVGNTEVRRLGAEAYTFVPTNAPVLSLVTNRSSLPGSPVVITNVVDGTPFGEWEWTLEPGAPSGATVDAGTGVFRWVPSCSQASRSFPVTVRVTDRGNPHLTDTATFTVDVSECVVPSLGRLVLEAGESGRVPVQLVTSVPLTNLTLTVSAPGTRVTGWRLEPLVTNICTSALEPVGDGKHRLTLGACTNQWLVGTQQVAWLHFTTVADQTSAFVDLTLDDMAGAMVDGTPVRNFAAQSGRLAVIGQEPLLEAVFHEAQGALLLLYGRPGWECEVQTRPAIVSPEDWQPYAAQTMTNLYHERPVETAGKGPQFFRAVRR